MTSFSKKYYSPKDSNKFLSVTWETGYKNIQVFYNNRLVHTVKNPIVLVEGIKIEDSELGTIKFRFTTERPRKLEIKVNNKKFKTINKIKLGYDYTGLITIFTTLAVLGCMGNVLILGTIAHALSDPIIIAVYIIDILIVISYGVTSYLLSKRKPSAFFIGAPIFTFTTLLVTLGSTVLISTTMSPILLVFRYGMLIYIITQARHILREMKTESSSEANEELLDNL